MNYKLPFVGLFRLPLQSLVNIFRYKKCKSKVENPSDNRPHFDMHRYLLTSIVVDEVEADPYEYAVLYKSVYHLLIKFVIFVVSSLNE